jgi:TorA maturation chaperone TorD
MTNWDSIKLKNLSPELSLLSHLCNSKLSRNLCQVLNEHIITWQYIEESHKL